MATKKKTQPLRTESGDKTEFAKSLEASRRGTATHRGEPEAKNSEFQREYEFQANGQRCTRSAAKISEAQNFQALSEAACLTNKLQRPR